MNWMEISVLTTHEASEAVANIFHEMRVGGVVVEDPVLINNLRKSTSWELCDIPEQEDIETVTIKAYLPADENFFEKMKQLEIALHEIETHFCNCKRGNTCFREICEEDWANAWKQYFHPIRVGQQIIIKPTWEDYEALDKDLIIELDPGMAFGTGTHHTTCLCIKTLEDVLQPNDTVFDVGTGSGILAVVSAKLGAAKVIAVDIDSTAVRVAKENVALNNVADIVEVVEGDLLNNVQGQADVIVANIIADIIIMVLPDILLKLKPAGKFLASGIIIERLEDVTTKATNLGFNIHRIIEQSGWAVVEMSRKED